MNIRAATAEDYEKVSYGKNRPLYEKLEAGEEVVVRTDKPQYLRAALSTRYNGRASVRKIDNNEYLVFLNKEE